MGRPAVKQEASRAEQLPDHLRYYDLAQEPFAQNAGEFTLENRSYQRIRAALLSGIRDGQRLLMLIGRRGTGKSHLINTILADLHETSRVTVISAPVASPEEFMLRLTQQLGLGFSEPTLHELVPNYLSYLKITARLGKKSLLIIDNAQDLNTHVFLLLRKLVEAIPARRLGLQILLVGRRELTDRLNKDKHAGFRRHIEYYTELPALKIDETGEYLRHRLAIAGAERAARIFDPSAVQRIFDLTLGIPLAINLLADRALKLGIVQRWGRICAGDIDKMIESHTKAIARHALSGRRQPRVTLADLQGRD